jgi:phosphoribosylaminoimidazole-succinocarboxamide synthase
MKILLMTSGSGSTARYLTEHLIEDKGQLANGIIHCGFVYEPHESIESNLKHLISLDSRIGNVSFFKVNRIEFTCNNEFHSSIWKQIAGMGIDLILLLGWMHIIPKSFIEGCETVGCKIVNLHPTLQYQLIGRDIYPKIWNMYLDGMIRETGCIVHQVSGMIDRGTVIHEKRLSLIGCPDYETYYTSMYGNMYGNMVGSNDNSVVVGLEKLCVWEALLKLNKAFLEKSTEPVDITPANWHEARASGLTLSHRGKVRDIYTSDYYRDYLYVTTSDRISANDIVISYLPGKGYLLNQINTFWHRLFGLPQLVASSDSNLMVIRKMRAVPLEIIIRRRLTGSLWKAYSQHGQRVINGYELKEGMTDGDLFTEPIITPTTKGTHDLPITFDEIVERGILNRRECHEIQEKATALFLRGEAVMRCMGIEMIDTKFEFAFDGKCALQVIDEVFTPDSSRFIVDGQRMDKDILRRWATDNEARILEHPLREDGCHDVALPEEIRGRLLSNYSKFWERLNATRGIVSSGVELPCAGTVSNGLLRLDKFVVILAGSKTDYLHVEKIRSELAKVDILCFVHYSSAHKNTHAVMNILKSYESLGKDSKIVYIAVAGMSNALGGVIAANVSRPVVSCPPFADRADYQVNIDSTLQMPSGVPSACVLRPDNVAGFCKRVLGM